MGTQIVALTSKIKQQETRLRGDIQVVSAMVISDKANQIRINNKVIAERNKIVALANKRHSSNVRARGMLKKLMDQNKAAAKEEVAALAKTSYALLAKLRGRQSRYRRTFAQDLTHATKKLHITLNKASAHQEQVLSGMKKSLTYTKAATAGQLRAVKSMFKSRVNTLVNAITANAASAQRGLRHMTKVARDWKHADSADRKLIRVQRAALKNDLDKALARAIQLGEARAKAVEERANENIASTKKALSSQIAVQVENMADNVFRTVQGNRQKIADNYLSLKAYAVSAADKITDYRAAGKGAGLSSIGDLLVTVGALGTVKPTAAEGPGMGGDKLQAIFSGKSFKVARPVASINGLVNEFTKSTNQVRNRWPMGLGKYLLDKLEISMGSKGVLQVDKVRGHHGNFVYMNGRSVGLSNKLSDFAALAVRMSTYESVLAKLTAKVSPPQKKNTDIVVKPPEYQGD